MQRISLVSVKTVSLAINNTAESPTLKLKVCLLRIKEHIFMALFFETLQCETEISMAKVV